MSNLDLIAVGTKVWNRYDLKWGTVIEQPTEFDIANGDGNWYSVRQEDGTRTTLDFPQRMVPATDCRAGH